MALEFRWVVKWTPLNNQLVGIQWPVYSKSKDKSEGKFDGKKEGILSQNKWKKKQIRFKQVTASKDNFDITTTPPQEDIKIIF
jgi:hypothetical protein